MINSALIGRSSRRATTFDSHDHLGTAKVQTNSAQAVTGTRSYDAFGLLVSSTGTPVGPFGFAGGYGYQEDASGLKLLGHRYYDPGTGRFLTRDHAKDGRNWYAYCNDRPTVATDPEGHFVWLIIVAVVAAVAIVVGLKNILDEGNRKVAPALKKSLDDAESPEDPPPTHAYPKEFRDWNKHIGKYVGDVAKDQYAGTVISKGLDTAVEGAGDVYDLLSGLKTIIEEEAEMSKEKGNGK